MDEKKVREAIDFIKTLITAGNGDERLYTAIEALQKQLPKKPKKLGNGDLACSCRLIIQRKNRRTCLYYCHNCGQAIDWSE
ncbi:MAG: hypothetical protein KHZ04_10970 [Dorea sp.]|uniref:hypothetical protein n=1 Tax=Dorea sp. TaxID=2040332 RepID=UPI002579FB6F|nr:hypothetical protein [Dorea sp.]MBS5105175.1 hypothetical protein [Dorea sp.]